MKVTAIQLNAHFTDVEKNCGKINGLIKNAVKQGAELILLPEFFSSGIGFCDKMLDVPNKNKAVPDFLSCLAKEHKIILGGSYLHFDGENVYNQFELLLPSGERYFHRKDIPTQFEHCYYTYGDEQNILRTPAGNFGIALCWEMLRYDTIKRLSGKVDVILSGSCWWDLPEDAPVEREPLRQYNQKLALNTPVAFAQLLHVPVIHANHCGKVSAYNFPKGDRLQTRQLVGGAQIIDASGNIIGRRCFQEGEGFVSADVVWNKTKEEAMIEDSKYWIPELPDSYLKAWETLNPLGEKYYTEQALPYYKKYNEI